jgi:hypothetical protein
MTTVFDPFLVKNQEDVLLTSCQTLVYSVTTSPDDLEPFVSFDEASLTLTVQSVGVAVPDSTYSVTVTATY